MKSKYGKKELAERMNILGMTFLSLVEEGSIETNVNMMKESYEPCGTSACHAGWFGVACVNDSDPATCLRYGQGHFFGMANQMADYLGLRSRHILEAWARTNPKLWGNNNADGMFNSPAAFGLYDRNVTLEDIGLHWLQVAARVKRSTKARV